MASINTIKDVNGIEVSIKGRSHDVRFTKDYTDLGALVSFSISIGNTTFLIDEAKFMKAIEEIKNFKLEK